MQMRTLFGVGVLGMSAIAGSASATIIASDSFTNGADPTVGQYTVNTGLQGQPSNLTTTGFATGGYTGGTGTTNFQAKAGGLSSAQVSGSGGEIDWLGLSAAAAPQNRSNARTLSPAISTTPTYYTSQILHLDPTTTVGTVGSFVGIGAGGSTAPLLNPAANAAGFYVGFAVTSATDTGSLTIRSRQTAANTEQDTILVNGTTSTVAGGGNFEVITKAEPNSSGSQDRITYWVNPTDTTSEATMSTTSLATGSYLTYALQGTSDLVRLNFAAVGDTASTGLFTDSSEFDEFRLGTALADVIPATNLSVPEPTTLAALAGVGLVALRRRRRA